MGNDRCAPDSVGGSVTAFRARAETRGRQGASAPIAPFGAAEGALRVASLLGQTDL